MNWTAIMLPYIMGSLCALAGVIVGAAATITVFLKFRNK